MLSSTYPKDREAGQRASVSFSNTKSTHCREHQLRIISKKYWTLPALHNTLVVIKSGVGLQYLPTFLASKKFANAMLATQMFLEGTARAVSTATQVAHGISDACAHLRVIRESTNVWKNKHAYFTLDSIIPLVFNLKSRYPRLYCMCIYRRVQLPEPHTGNCLSFLEKPSLKMLGFPAAWVTGPTSPGDW